MNIETAPVKEGEILEVEITAQGKGGDGIAKVMGFTLFVPGTKVGDKVKIKVNKILSTYGFAEIAKEESK